MASRKQMDFINRSTCVCGFVARSYAEEAKHRHNFPILCKPKVHLCEGRKNDGGKCNRKTTHHSGKCNYHR